MAVVQFKCLCGISAILFVSHNFFNLNFARRCLKGIVHLDWDLPGEP